MAQNQDPLKKILKELTLLHDAPDSELIPKLSKYLSTSKSPVIAAAANMIKKRCLAELIPELMNTATLLFSKDFTFDRGCLAKTALIETLDSLEADAADLFYFASSYRQLEPVAGGYEDRASKLRARAIAGVVRMRHPNQYIQLAKLLFDPCEDARIGAVWAAEYAGTLEAELLLIMKLLAGDKGSDLEQMANDDGARVLGECMSALLKLNPDSHIEFIVSFFYSHSSAISHQACLSVGESKHPRAFSFLHSFWSSLIHAEDRRRLILPIALTRSDDAYLFLLEQRNENASYRSDIDEIMDFFGNRN